MTDTLRIPALKVQQSEGRTLFTFAVDGKLVERFATVSRLRRDGESLCGYQRPEAYEHIVAIRTYVESTSPLMPNAVVLAFDSSVRFVPHTPGPSSDYSQSGELLIPLPPEDAAPESRPGFIVDGQQRLAAIRDAAVERFPICVSEA